MGNHPPDACRRLTRTGIEPHHPEISKQTAGILKVEDIQEWLEEHPEVKLEGALVPLKDLKFDDNPVMVIVEP